MKKVAYFFASFLPFIMVIFFQLISIVFVIGFAMLFAFPAFSLPTEHGTIRDFLEILRHNANDLNAIFSIIFSIMNIIIFGLWYHHLLGGSFLPSLRKTFSGCQLAGVIILVPGAQFACGFLVALLSVLMPKWLEQYEKLMESAGMDNSITPLMLFYAVIMAPLGEEIAFRGVTMRLARQSLPFFFANLLQAFLFGVMHGNWMQGCYAFALGILLGYVCEKGGSIYYSILLHFLFNFWGTIISPYMEKIDNEVVLALIMIGGTILSLFIGILLFALGVRGRKRRIANDEAKQFAING